MAQAMDHRISAERSTCLTEQHELHRVADIYEVLATIDVPLSRFAVVEGPSETDSVQFADPVE